MSLPTIAPRVSYPHFGFFGTGQTYGYGTIWQAGLYHASRPLAVNLLRPIRPLEAE